MKGIMIVGYVEVNGIRTFSDDVIAGLWDRLEKDGTFYIFNKNEVSNRGEFVRFMKASNVYPALCVIDDEIGGFGWLQDLKGNYAEANYFMFKKYWGKRTIEMACALTKYWLGFEVIDVLIGYTPKKNEKACRFLKYIGWTVVGTIPFLDEGKDMLISYATRGENNG
jgi:RimJ/RimL family protein N-acetyltransferase